MKSGFHIECHGLFIGRETQPNPDTLCFEGIRSLWLITHAAVTT